MDGQALFLSLSLAAATTGLLALLGLPLAAWLAFSRARWKPLVEAVVALPLVLPPTVLGFYVLLAIGPEGPLGRLLSPWGIRLAFSFSGLLLASTLFSLPFAVQPFAAGFAAVPLRTREAAATLGAGPVQTFLRVVLPQAWPGVLTGLVLSFAHTLGEFGVVLMVGGNIPGQTRTVSIAIFDHVQALEYGAAARTAAFLLAVSFLVLLLTYGLRRKEAPWRLF
ncbi:MAG: molybdate ABC transporter permease subunit [Acidobacteria bacterium]|nr:molybdate ABC transporter permease subunit [Acidobacteriota bacterium]